MEQKEQVYKLMIKQTLLELFPDSLNSFFHREAGTGTTEYPEATKIPIHKPYPNPLLHHPCTTKEHSA